MEVYNLLAVSKLSANGSCNSNMLLAAHFWLHFAESLHKFSNGGVSSVFVNELSGDDFVKVVKLWDQDL